MQMYSEQVLVLLMNLKALSVFCLGEVDVEDGRHTAELMRKMELVEVPKDVRINERVKGTYRISRW